jgi:hypothetical protein
MTWVFLNSPCMPCREKGKHLVRISPIAMACILHTAHTQDPRGPCNHGRWTSANRWRFFCGRATAALAELSSIYICLEVPRVALPRFQIPRCTACSYYLQLLPSASRLAAATREGPPKKIDGPPRTFAKSQTHPPTIRHFFSWHFF